MKRTILSAAVILLLLLILCPAAFADVTYPDPAPLEVGQTLNHLAASVEPGSSVTVSAGALPPGVDLVLDEQDDAMYVYLRGVPTQPGYYDAILDVNAQSSFMFSVDVEPAMPHLIVGPNVTCSLNDIVHISVTASISDSGVLSYQWYASDGSSQGSLIAGATDPIYQPGTDYVGTTYYYCVVTNMNNGLGVSVVSPSILVTVEAARPSALSVSALPTRTAYNVGDTLDPYGLQLTLTYSNGATQLITSGYQIYPTLLDTAGDQIIEVSYLDQRCSFIVSVAEAPTQEVIDGIGVLTLPYRTSYVIGEQLDPSGLSIRVYSNLGTRDVSDGLICSPLFLSQEGTQTITVSYMDKTCTFTVSVESEEVPSYLSLHRLPNRLNYNVGDTLDTSGLVLYLISSKNNAMEVVDGYQIAPTRLDQAGQQEITVTYGGFTASFKVNVSAAAATPTPAVTQQPTVTPVPTEAPAATPAPAEETPAPVTSAFPVMPTHTPIPSRTVGSGKNFIGVIAAASVLALLILGAYVYIMNRGGFDALEEKLESLFRRGGGRHKK